MILCGFGLCWAVLGIVGIVTACYNRIGRAFPRGKLYYKWKRWAEKSGNELSPDVVTYLNKKDK